MVGLSGCKKINQNDTNWTTSNSIPIGQTYIEASELLNFNFIDSNSDEELFLNLLEKNINFEIDSIFTIPDTTFIYSLDSLDIANINIPGGTTFELLPSETVSFDLAALNATQFDLKAGKLLIKVQSSLDKSTLLRFKCPSAKKSTDEINSTIELNPGSISIPSSAELEIDLADYNVNLVFDNNYNSINYSVSGAVKNLNDTLVINESDFVSVEVSFKDIKPKYLKGSFLYNHIVSNTIIYPQDYIDTRIDGQFDFQEFIFNIDIHNYTGVDIQAKLASIKSFLNNSYTTIQSEITQEWINLGRALDSQNELPIATSESIEWNKSNSNLNDLLSPFPDSIILDYEFIINPMGNHSLDNDFIYADKNIAFDVGIFAPMKFSLKDFYFQDTIEFKVSIDSLLRNTSNISLNLIGLNSFPFEINPKVIFYDAQHSIVDSILAENQYFEIGRAHV